MLIAPAVLSSVGGNGHASLSWTPRKGATGYKVYYGTSSGVYEHSLDTLNSNVLVEGLTNGIPHYLVVTAYNGDGIEGPFSPEVMIIPAASHGTMGSISFDKASYAGQGGSAVITLVDADLNMNPTALETVEVRIVSQSDPGGIRLGHKETAVDSGIFTSTSSGKDLGFTSGESDDVNELLRTLKYLRIIGQDFHFISA